MLHWFSTEKSLKMQMISILFKNYEAAKLNRCVLDFLDHILKMFDAFSIFIDKNNMSEQKYGIPHISVESVSVTRTEI